MLNNSQVRVYSICGTEFLSQIQICNPYILTTRAMLQTLDISKYRILLHKIEFETSKVYQGSGCKELGIRKFGTQFLCYQPCPSLFSIRFTSTKENCTQD